MNLFIFTNSTGCMCYEGTQFIPGASYVDALQEYRPEGIWINGTTILNVRKVLPNMLKGSDRVAILHLGVCEALSHPDLNFVNLWIAHLFQQDVDPDLYQVYIVPKMLRAIENAANKREEKYLVSLEPNEFLYILDGVFWLLQGTKTLMIGMSQPNGHNHWVRQAQAYNDVMESVCVKYNVTFLNVWDSLSEYVQDSSHLNIEGHKQLLEKVKEFING